MELQRSEVHYPDPSHFVLVMASSVTDAQLKVSKHAAGLKLPEIYIETHL
jgi:hypothetical protein